MTFDDRSIAEDPDFIKFSKCLYNICGHVIKSNQKCNCFSVIQEMLTEVNRLITKYSAAPWTDDTNDIRLVSLLNEYVPLLQAEISEVQCGTSTLSKSNILGHMRERPSLAVLK